MDGSAFALRSDLGLVAIPCCLSLPDVVDGRDRLGGKVASAWANAAQELLATGTKGVWRRQPWVATVPDK